MVTTTSPSYPILSSLDYAGIYGRKLYTEDVVLTQIKALKQALTEETPLRILDSDDCYKLLVNCDNCELSATTIQKELEEKYSIYIEGVFGNNLLLMFSPCNTLEELNVLEKALFSLSLEEKEHVKKISTPILRLIQTLSPREAYFAKGELVPKEKAVGRVSKENITQFPPCVPLVTVGETFTEEAVLLLEKDYVEVVK